jgi:hypothetical protein
MESLRFDTMPSRASLQAWAKTVGPSRRPPLAVKTSSPTISTGCSVPSAGPMPISIIPAQKREDRAYLVRLTAANTGLAQPDAERRIDEVAARAKENIARARRSAVFIAFTAGASALLGAAASWFAACAGGRIRDGEAAPHALLDWGKPIRRP